jgi:hypothetical protein
MEDINRILVVSKPDCLYRIGGEGKRYSPCRHC